MINHILLKSLVPFLLFTISFTQLLGQTSLNLLGNLTYDGIGTNSNQELSDLWGYASNGNEYAIVGLIDGTSIVDITDPANPNEVYWSSGANTFWRDIVTWSNYAYIVNEGGGGLKIIDLSNLPVSATETTFTGGTLDGTSTNINFSTAHNLYIDENGIGYIFGADYGVGGTIMLDIASNPTNPSVIGLYNLRYSHDGFARGDTLYSAEINDGIFSIVDVSIKSNPIVIGTASTTNNFTHNVWLSDNGNYLFTTDEVSGAEIGAYDISDVTDIQRVDGIKSTASTNTIVHNTHVLNDFLITSYYRDGVTVVDANCPDILVEVANYDTSPQFSGNGFNGCWGVYPFLPSGHIIAADIENGLYIIDNNYGGASYLIGNVTDENGAPLNNVNITVSGVPQGFTSTDLAGDYKTGIAGSGTYQVVYSVSGYSPVAVNVNFQLGVKAVQDIQFLPATLVNISGTILDAGNFSSVPNAQLIFKDLTNDNKITANASGQYSINLNAGLNYELTIGAWGYISEVIGIVSFTNSSINNYTLEKGYCDDFLFDFNWQSSTNSATTGLWVLGEPIGTDFNGLTANPNFDVSIDLGNNCYMTGNGGGSGGTDDIDGGTVFLLSPVFDLSGYNNPVLTFARWFFMDGGNQYPDDTLNFEINSNGVITNILSIVDGDAGESSWVVDTFQLANLVTLSSNMQFRVIAEDNGAGHISEAALDAFCIVDMPVAPACPQNLSVTGTIATGTYIADDIISSDGKVTAGSYGQVIFNAGFNSNEYIELLSGFEADGSFDFVAENVQCDLTD